MNRLTLFNVLLLVFIIIQLIYFAVGMCTHSRVSFSLFSYKFFMFWTIPFEAGHHFEGKILKPGRKIFLGGHTAAHLKVK